jgi:HD-GYP domain-containing protein (c-di-GMP phosphodiesterase class II)
MTEKWEIETRWATDAEEMSRTKAAFPLLQSDWEQSFLLFKDQLKKQYDIDQVILIARVTETTRAISGSLEPADILSTVVVKAAELIQADAGAIALPSPNGNAISYPYLYNLPDFLKKKHYVRGLSREVMETRTSRLVPDYAAYPDALPEWLSTGIHAVVSVPMLYGKECYGALNLFSFTPGKTFTEPELCLVESVGWQAASAMNNAALFDSLQRAHGELALAYDATLVGWAKALELRDRETEGPSRRVPELSQRLAREMGIQGKEDLVRLRQGALLHDIGKMGIPDQILLKPGPLSEEEWLIMRKHPVYARDLLADIPYLVPALEIPYSHHEKWDGTGYPLGIKGEKIPLEARLFAIVDVWDALRSDRPYHKAWPVPSVVEHIRTQSGKHFDPDIVNIFLDLVP